MARKWGILLKGFSVSINLFFHDAAWAIWETVSPKLPSSTIASPVISAALQPGVPSQKLLESLSFNHFAELLAIADPIQRHFYEIECIRGNWSVRALRRQISSLYFARSGLSQDKDKLSAMRQAAEQNQARLEYALPRKVKFGAPEMCAF